MASKKQKKTAEFIPLLIALGPTPLKKPFQPYPSAIRLCTDAKIVGRCDAEHIIRVLMTSSGVVAAAAAAPALPPIRRSANGEGCSQSGSLVKNMKSSYDDQSQATLKSTSFETL